MRILSGAAIFNDVGKILLVQQKEDGPQPLLWGLPGGHGEKNEGPEDVAIREVKEETNLDIKLTNFVHAGLLKVFDGTEYIIVTYKAKARNLDLLKIDTDEVKNYGWFSLEDITKEKVKFRGNFLKDPILKAFSKKLSDTGSFSVYCYTKEEAING